MTPTPLPIKEFAALFSGLDTAYGTGKGSWVKAPPSLREFAHHLTGQGDGLGIAPLRGDGTVSFAAIDLDAPDFESAFLMRDLLPGETFVEVSRSGNCHVWSFFREPVEAWVVRGIMREATAAIGNPRIEVFPKQDRLRPGMVGSYINLPYYGNTRPILWPGRDKAGNNPPALTVQEFIGAATNNLNDPSDWRKRARWLGVPSPEERVQANQREFGTQPFLHICAEHIIESRDTIPVVEGHRAVVFFCLAKQLANCELFDHDEALQMMALVNDSSPDPIQESELQRILFNAERGAFTSTGCDDPLFGPYASPECPIAKAGR